jgi:hypothetical protein
MQAAERLDKQFRENQDAITNIQQQLLQKLASLPTTTKQEKDLRDFINDRGDFYFSLYVYSKQNTLLMPLF